MRWRSIITDSESESGVAPACPQPDVHAMMHGGDADDPYVYDECCVGPHIECFSPSDADSVVDALNAVAQNEGAEMCS